MTGVPAGVKDHNPVRSDQVHTKASRSRGHKEEFHLVVSRGLFDHPSGSCVSVSVFEVARYVSFLFFSSNIPNLWVGVESGDESLSFHRGSGSVETVVSLTRLPRVLQKDLVALVFIELRSCHVLTYSGIPGRTTFIYVTSVGKKCEKYSSIYNVLNLFIYVGFTPLNIS